MNIIPTLNKDVSLQRRSTLWKSDCFSLTLILGNTYRLSDASGQPQKLTLLLIFLPFFILSMCVCASVHQRLMSIPVPIHVSENIIQRSSQSHLQLFDMTALTRQFALGDPLPPPSEAKITGEPLCPPN